MARIKSDLRITVKAKHSAEIHTIELAGRGQRYKIIFDGKVSKTGEITLTETGERLVKLIRMMIQNNGNKNNNLPNEQ